MNFSNEQFCKIIDAAKVILSTVPMTDSQDRYKMHDMSWILHDPLFTVQLLFTVYHYQKNMGDAGIEEGIRIFSANAFSRANKTTTIQRATERIDKLLEIKGKS